MNRALFIFFLLFCHSVVQGQENEIRLDKHDSLKELEEIAHKMVNDSLLDDRVQANKLLKRRLIEVLDDPNSKNLSFETLKSVSVVPSGNDKFRIFSWQLYISPNQYQHEGIIQFLKEDRDLIVLNDQSDHILQADRIELSPEKWYGALYYNMVPFKSKGKQKYLLFGFDGATSRENCKVADILSFNNDQVTFGEPLFVSKLNGIAKKSYRLLHAYDQNVKAIMNYDPNLEIIIFDHLIPWTSKEIGVGMTFVPDGSYQGYQFKKGKWHYLPKVFNHISLSPVGPANPNGSATNNLDKQD